ncbi:NAD(P)H-dependent FMN reductase [Georgenia satyanarayanai]|uniref:NAD(P)H-dependent FMN reductase n=1 Tax=Georgenia satyanarayanai TaxID=860221 RepID=A0A2Y9ASL6_9MICO|nr:NAD(P)H-dependent oxidoreductase [Georgenia satyanarayanai]PYF97873.1 NAD(P)H-dependent FMN reductase [Georgenia satyanarayanai]SSA45447.1 NAD(P)H-dependent FMN reductase [Georgenia satyanarayanai]
MSTQKIGVIVSSTRPTRVGDKVAQWVASIAPEGTEVEVVDLAEVDLPFLVEPELPATGNYTLASTVAWSERIRSYDGLVITVPEYNAGYPAVLKNAIDSLHAEWNGLPIGVVGYGWGAAAGAARQLGEVLDRVKAVHLPGPGLSFGQDLTPEGEILEAAPAEDVQGLYNQVLTAVREKVTV